MNIDLSLASMPYSWNCARLFSPKRYHSETAVVTFSLMAFAIIKTGGRQYRVAEGDAIDVDLLKAEAGKQIVLSDVQCTPMATMSRTADRSTVQE